MEIRKVAARGYEKLSSGKKVTNVERMCMILSDGKWHTGAELAEKCGWRFGGVVHRLRHDYGIEIETDGKKKGVHNYRAVI